MKLTTFLLIPLILYAQISFSQTEIDEIADKKVASRVQLIRHRTDSFLTRMTTPKVFKKLIPYFGATFINGEFGKNYQFLNEQKIDPEDIYNLEQYYYISDSSLGVSEWICIYYLEVDKIEVGFKKEHDHLVAKALDYLYQDKTILKMKTLIKEKHLKQSYIKIEIDDKNYKYAVLLKDQVLPHKYLL